MDPDDIDKSLYEYLKEINTPGSPVNIKKAEADFYNQYYRSIEPLPKNMIYHSVIVDYLTEDLGLSTEEADKYLLDLASKQSKSSTPGISIEEFKKIKNIDTTINVVDEVPQQVDTPETALADDVKEVTNDFTFNKFAEKQRTADSVIFRELEDGTIELLVIKRKRGPHRSLYALPGGIVESTVLDDEKILQAVIDPGKPFMRETTMHEYFIPFDPKQIVDVGSSANEIFAREGLREAIEEVGIDRTVIKNASPLPVKYDRFDWDARAAKGVDVGGIVMLVDNDWVPTARDDAKSYEWIKLDDVANGNKELAFGHAEFVENGFYSFYKKDVFQKSNWLTTVRDRKSKYGIDIVNKLQNIKKQNSARNVEIIKAANVVREQLGQPLINTNTTSFIDKENRAMINSIRSIGYRDVGKSRFTAAQRLEPDMIFYDIMHRSLNRDFQTNFIVEEDLVEVVQEVAAIGQEPEEPLNKIVKLKPEAQARVVNEIKEKTLQAYASNLKMMVNDGMQISPLVNNMLENARSIIYSEDFDKVLNEVLKDGVELKVFKQNDETGKVVYDIVGYKWSEPADFATLHPENQVFKDKGLKEAIDGNLKYLSNNWEDIAQPLKNIRERNNQFYKNTFPEEVYMDPIQWWKSSGQNFPEAALDIKKLQKGPNNTLIGMTYHGSQGLNQTGREVMKILKDEIPKLNVSSSTQQTVQQFDNAWDRYLNKIATENNLDWLDPTKNRGGMLRGSVMYTTNNPGLAASYALGGHAGDLVTYGRNKINEAIHILINNKDILDVNDTKKFNKLNSKLNKYGLQLVPNWQNLGEVALRTFTDEPAFLVSPIIMQNNFKVPIEKMLHTDMPVTRQLNNPTVRKALNAALKNSGPEILLDRDDILNNALDNLIEVSRQSREGATGRFGVEYTTGEEQVKITDLLVEARDNPKSANRQYIKEYLLKNMQYTTELKTNRIKDLIDTGQGSWNDVVKTFANNAGFGQQINPDKLQEAINYLKMSDASYYSNERSFHNFNITAGEVLFDMEFNNWTSNKEVIKLDDLIEFIKQADVSIVGGNYAATNDLMYLKKIFAYFENNPELYTKFMKAFKTINNWTTMQKKAVTSADGTVMYFIEVQESLLRNTARSADETIFNYSLKIDPENNLRGLKDEFNTLVDGKYDSKFRKEVNEVVLANSGVSVGKDKELTLFLEQVTGLNYNRSNINSIGNNDVLADYLGMKSLAEGGVEVTMGTGGGKAGANFHDNLYIVDPGNKFGVKEPKLSEFITNAIEFDIETLKIIDDITKYGTSFADLDDNQIRKVAEFIPIEQVINDTEITTAQKERWSKIYNSLNITDNRFRTVEGIQPLILDGVFLNLNKELQELIAYQSLHGDIKAPVIQNHITQLYGEVAAQVDPQDVIPVMKSTGILRMLGNGLDMYDAAVFAPVLLDLIMSRTTGVGSTTETIGGSIAEVAMNVYDPSKEDTAFEATWGSPEDPRTLAGGVGNSVDIIKDPLVEVAKENPLLAGMFNSIKEGAISALSTVKNGLGLNEWVYNVKRDMYVSSALKEMGYDVKGKQIPKGLVQKLEGEYESYLPNNEDKYGRPLDVGDTSNMPDYTKGVFRR